MIPHKIAAFLVLALVLGGPGGGFAALRIESPGVEPFFLAEVATEDSTGWYDAQTWLSHFPGAVDWDPSQQRLTYREGQAWAALRPEAPFAVRDGRALRGPVEVRFRDGRLLVSEAFLREVSGEFLARPVRVEGPRRGPARRITLDPGHGGGDGGSRGPRGLAEKDVVLELAHAAAQRLRERGFEVHLTRSDDRALELIQRAAVANYRGANLFVSLHAAGEGRPQARGIEVFVAPEPPEGADSSHWSAGQAGLGEESRRWADLLRRSLGEALPTFDRGLGVIPHPMLEAVAAPACLVELGSLAWPQEADLLRSPEGREAVAEAIVRAAEAYFR
ncbi:MAG: N-acetylmuramoyl-L-alanine amidase [Deferrisomatales bacterium]|nr:N-acetylmuramoyl-L-alanine amidase [Deferrisomatales bacterium]